MRFLNGTSQIPPAPPPSQKMNGPLHSKKYYFLCILFSAVLYPLQLRGSNWMIAVKGSALCHMYCKASWQDYAVDFK